MELTKELKEKLINAESREEAKKILEEVGLELTDEMLDQVAGGISQEEVVRQYKIAMLT